MLKYINVCYNPDKMLWSYEETHDQKVKETQELSKYTQESLGKLLEHIGSMPEELKKIYEKLYIFLNIEDFTKDEVIKAQSELHANHIKLSWAEYKDNKEAQAAIKIYDVIFLDPRSSVNEAVSTITKMFDDKDITMWIKNKISLSLRKYFLSNMVYDVFDFVDVYKINDLELKEISNKLMWYKRKSKLSIEDYETLISYQSILNWIKYKNNKNADVLKDIISKIFNYDEDTLYKIDLLKWVEISNKLYEKYQWKYNFEVVNDDWKFIEYISF